MFFLIIVFNNGHWTVDSSTYDTSESIRLFRDAKAIHGKHRVKRLLLNDDSQKTIDFHIRTYDLLSEVL